MGSADPTNVGPFQLLGVLGAGGMGRVYLGTSRTGRRVAIKVIRPDLAEDSVFRDRFAREVDVARLVSPLFTAAVVDADTDADAPWLATTFIDGVSLDRRVLDDGPMSGDEVLSLAAGLGEALTSIHSVGLVHRDLKPSNILLNERGPHIIDFGLALGSGQTRLTTSLVVGTPSYMAPERLRGDEAGTSSDIFSLGATLAFAGTGRDLVDDASVYEQVLQIAEGRFDLSDVPSRMRAIVVRCVSFEPHDRPTAAELTRFVVALAAATPGRGVDDVTVKITSQRRARAAAAGLPGEIRIDDRPRHHSDSEAADPIRLPSVVAPRGAPGWDEPIDPHAWDWAREADRPRSARHAAISQSFEPIGPRPSDGLRPPHQHQRPGGPRHVADARPSAERDGLGDRSSDGQRPSGEPHRPSAPRHTPVPVAAASGASAPSNPPHGSLFSGGSVHLTAERPIVPRQSSGHRLAAVRATDSRAAEIRAYAAPDSATVDSGSLTVQPWDDDATEAIPRTADVATTVLASDSRPGQGPTPPPRGGADGNDRAPHPSDPGATSHRAENAPTPRAFARRRFLMAGAFAAVAAVGAGVAAADLLSGRRGARVSAGTLNLRGADTSAVKPGSVLWTANSGATPPRRPPPSTGPLGQRVVVTSTGVIVSVQAGHVAALDRTGQTLWQRPLTSGDGSLWLWGHSVLIVDGNVVTLLDTMKFQTVSRHPASLAAARLNREETNEQITGIALATNVAYIGLSMSLIALDRSLHLKWATTAANAGTATPETPIGASDDWMASQTFAGGSCTVALYHPAGGESWRRSYHPADLGIDGPPAGPPPGGPGGPDGPSPVSHPPAPPDPAMWTDEAVVTSPFTVVRTGRDIHVLSTSQGRTQWSPLSARPVHGMAVAGSSMIVASDTLALYDLTSQAERWTVPLTAVRVAVASQPSIIVAATTSAVVGLDMRGRTLWTARLPSTVSGAEPTCITIAPHAAYVTYRPSGTAGTTADIVAVSVDGKSAH